MAHEAPNYKSLLQKAYRALEDMQQKLHAGQNAQREPIAIIGMGCRFPGPVANPAEFWSLLRDGRDAIRAVPAERWQVDAYYDADPDAAGKMYCRAGGFLGDVAGFDPLFFGIAPREAASMDPQQRLLLEVCWEALENAALSTSKLAGSRTGVFVGICNNDYASRGVRGGDAAQIDAYIGTGTAFSVAAGRIAYLLGLHGPVMAVDTACSSALVAVDLACQSLRAHKCAMALAAGVNLILAPESMIYFCKVRALAADGRCKTFAASADGYGRGEGCGAIVLKRLGDALREGDPILAVIRGSAVNHDGRTSGLTVPNRAAQEEVIRQALADAGVKPQDIGCIEAHGTGTPLGDPIEMRALANVFAASRTQPLLVGSVKTNLGHLEAAAGMAGLIKVVLSLQHRAIPAHQHFDQPNPHIPWRDLPFVVPVRLTEWAPLNERRLAGISSFGFSGTNAHVVVEEAPASHTPLSPGGEGRGVNSATEETPRHERPLHVLALSGQNDAALMQLAERWSSAPGLASTPSDVLTGAGREDTTTLALADLAHTANAGRAHFASRLAVVGADASALRDKLASFVKQTKSAGVFNATTSGDPVEVVFLFPGQGAQYAEMGRTLYETQPTFRRVIEQCTDILRPHLEKALVDVLYPPVGETSPLEQTLYTQPALFAVEYALAQVWQSWGIEPALVLGHSAGEYAAACLAGVFRLEDALELLACRARLMQEHSPEGAMAAVFTSAERLRPLLQNSREQPDIAAMNSPENTVISGAPSTVRAALQQLAQVGIKGQLLPVSRAFHSALMEPMLTPFTEKAAAISYAPPRIAMLPTCLGFQNGDDVARADYWRQQARQPVDFAAAMRTLHERGYRVYLEIGPRPTLLALGRRNVPELDQLWLPSLRPGSDCWRPMLHGLCELYVRGCQVDWHGFDRDYPRRRLAGLPTYPFQRQRYWFSPLRDDSQLTSSRSDLPATPLLRDADDQQSQSLTQQRLMLIERLRACPARERPEMLAEYLQTQLAEVLGMEEPPSPRRGFADLGMDSLMAVELRRRLERGLGRTLPSSLAFDFPTIERLANYLLEQEMGSPPIQPAALESPGSGNEPIAIVGLACRVPGGGNSPAEFWQLLCEGTDAVVAVPPRRWDVDAWYSPDPDAAGKMYTREAGFLNVPVEDFDASFFGITPREALSMDPQQRLLLELCWEALEHSGHSAEGLVNSRTGVFIGINTNDYARLRSAADHLTDPYSFTGNTFSVAAGRLSYTLGLQGPSLAIDTSCSSSLVAVHLACQSLHNGECRLALAGGVNLILAPDGNVVLSRMRALAPDGRCKSFAAAADGYGRGEGGGIVVLKRLADAIAERDNILAVIRGSAINHDGPASGLTVPNGPAQEAVIRQALARAGIEPAQIGYLEAHGTGTPLGDPIEMAAVGRALCHERPDNRPLLVGSVKTNIGHLEAAAGVAALIKATLALHHGRIPAHLHFAAPSPHTSWDKLPVVIPTETMPWPDRGGPRIAGVSSFGMSGTNAHLVLQQTEEAQREPQTSPRPWRLLTLSARSERALRELTDAFANHLQSTPQACLDDICFTAGAGRSHFSHRLAVVGSSMQEMVAKMSAADGEVLRGKASEVKKPKIAFLFPAEGWPEPGVRELYESEPAFRRAIDECCEAAPQEAECLLNVFGGGSVVADLNRNDRNVVRFALQYALAALWHSWGIDAHAVAGCGVGEYAAACVAKIVSLADALRLAAAPAEEIPGIAAATTCSAPRLRFISTIAGRQVAEDASDYWRQPLTAPTRLADAMRALLELGVHIYVEMGTGREFPIQVTPESDPVWLPSLAAGGSPWRRLLETLGHLYVHGCSPHWEQICAELAPRRVVLPTYPFQRKRFWAEPDRARLATRAATTNCFYELRWRVTERAASNGHTSAGQWLIFLDDQGVGQKLARQLRGRGDACFTVSPGDAFHVDEGDYTLPENDPAQYERLCRQLAERQQLPWHGVVHLRTLDITTAAGRPLEDVQLQSCGSALHLLQALIKVPSRGRPRLWLVTRGAQAVAEHEELAPLQAPIWGMGRALRFEHPELWGGLIDLDPQSTRDSLHLYEEVTGAHSLDDVAFRGGARYAVRLEHSAEPTATADVVLRDDATYLITGGLGSLGLRLAAWLLERGARHLLLVGRRPPSAEAQQVIEQFQGRGRIVVASADIAQHEQAATLLQGIRATMPPLAGIIHAAGVLDDGVLMRQDWSRFVKVMAPKVSGTWNLHELTSDMKLDFFVCFSSLASMLGSPGQSNYAAANVFMDVLAHYRRRRGLPALSLNWGPWADVGMAADLARSSTRQWTPEGVTAIPVGKGLQFLGQALHHKGNAQIGILPIDWGKFATQFPVGGLPPILSEVLRGVTIATSTSAPAASELLKRLAEAPVSRRRQVLVEHVQQTAARVMGLDSSELPAAELGFFDMGFDSLMALDMKNHLSLSLGHDLPSTVAFQHPTIDALVDYLLADVFREVPAPADCAVHTDNEAARALDDMSEDELLALLDSSLSKAP